MTHTIEFKPWAKIQPWNKVEMTITQKLNGTNGQIVVTETGLLIGSRTRYLGPTSDNFGFWAWCMHREKELLKTLPVGTYYGEFCGPGIQNGEGLTEKTFILFNPPEGVVLPEGLRAVPVLFKGHPTKHTIDEVTEDLKRHGSYLVPGFMNVEGIVIRMGSLFKLVFTNEETAWQRPNTEYKAEQNKEVNKVHEKVRPMLQPIRMSKVLSRDSRLLEGYPRSMSTIVSEYMKDLAAETGKSIQSMHIDTTIPAAKVEKLFYGWVCQLAKAEVKKDYPQYYHK